MINIGIIGAGGIVKQRHLPGLAPIEDARVIAVCNRSQASGEAVARAWNIPRVVTDWRELLAMDDVHAVFIGTWPYTHAEMTVAALEAGKHVFCQARMARTYADAQVMLAAAERHPTLATMLCPPPHAMKGDHVVRRLLNEGFIGAPREVHATGLSAGNLDATAPLHWRQNFELQGYNTLTLGMWIEVIHRWMGYHRQVAAVVKTHTPERRDPETGKEVPVRIAESLAIAAEFENGAVAAYHFSGVTPRPLENRIELHGTGGSLIYLIDSDRILGARLGEAELQEIPIPPDEARAWTVEADFLTAVRAGGGPTEPSFRDGLKYMEFTEAVYRAAETGETQQLPWG